MEVETTSKLDMALDDIPSGGKAKGNRSKGSRSTPYGGGGGGDAATQGRRVFVGNLAYSVAWQDLKDHMKQVRCALAARRAPRCRPPRLAASIHARSSDGDEHLRALASSRTDGIQAEPPARPCLRRARSSTAT